jgi:transcriptional regulator with GAF, ATPase, and Fis domain
VPKSGGFTGHIHDILFFRRVVARLEGKMMRKATDREETGRSSRHESERDALLAAARAVLRLESFEKTARIIFDEACRLTRARSGYVALLSESGQENEVLFLEAGGLACSVDPNLPMPIRGLRAEAYRRNRTVFDNDFAKSEWSDFLPAGHVDLENVLFAPLVIEGQTRGIMGLANKPEDFTEHDVEIATALGEIAAIALVNSRNVEKLNQTVSQLEKALSEVHTLRGIIPMCASCRKIRNEEGYWQMVEEYISEHSEAHFSHGLCQKCRERLYPGSGCKDGP